VYEQQLDKLKESKRKGGEVVIDKYILEPTTDLLKFLNKDKLEHAAVADSKKLRK